MNGISHKQAIQWIHRRLDGLLNESQLLALDEHLRSCDSCRAYATHMDGLSAHLQNEFHRRWDVQLGPSQKVFEHVTTKAGKIPMANRISSGVKLLAGAMTLIILGIAINFVVSRLESTSAVTNATETVDHTALPSDRLLAFASEQNGNVDIYTMRADGSEMRNITNNPAIDVYPFWSPDGKRIAFMSDRDGSRQIYLMDADGSNVIQLTNGEGSYGFDVNGYTPWSPDGRKLIFSHKLPEEQSYKLYILDITEKTQQH
jgi:WD40 repeat protein